MLGDAERYSIGENCTVGMNCSIGRNVNVNCNTVIGNNVTIGNQVSIGENVVIEDGVTIKDGSVLYADSKLKAGVYVDCQTIIRENVTIEENTFIGARCILGEYLADFMQNRGYQSHATIIGKNCLIRSETIIYGKNCIAHDFQTGHRVTIREDSHIGHHVRIGTLSDIQGSCEIGNYVNMHSNVHIGQKSVIKDYVWIFPYVILTNDPNPPSEELLGVTVDEFAIISTGTIVLPGKHIGKDALIGAGSIVTKDVADGKIVIGSPIRETGDVDNIRNKVTGDAVYPWRYHFDRGMPWHGIGYERWMRESGKEDI